MKKKIIPVIAIVGILFSTSAKAAKVTTDLNVR